MTTRLGTRPTVTIRPLTTPQTAPIAERDRKTTASETCGWCTYSTPVAYAEIPRTDPIERSTFRVMMTIVSPIASSAMMAEPARICWTFAALRKRWLSIVVAADDDHEREHDPELAEARQELGERVRAGARLDDALLLGDRRHAASSTRPVAARMIASSSASARSNSRMTRPSNSTTTRSAMPSTSGQLGGDHEDGDALRGELGEQAVHLRLRPDVDAARRLVDDQERRLAAEPLRKDGLLLVAARQRPDRVRQLRVLQPQAQRPVAREGALGAAEDEAASTNGVEGCQRDVALDREVHDEALLPPVLGDEPDSRRHRRRGRARRAGACRRSRPSRRLQRSIPKIARATSVRPAPTRPASATISPLRTTNETSVKSPSRVRRSTFSTTRPGLGRHLREQRVHVTADHRADHGLHGQLLDRLRPDVAAVAHHGDPLADREDLVEAVRDEEDGVAPGAQRLDDAEQPLDLVRRQRRGRLVHHDDARVRRQRLRDLDELLIGDREAPGEPVRVEPDAELLEQRCGLAPHPSPVDSSEALERLDADEDVLGDAQVGEERRLLEDDRDSGLLRLLGVVEDRLLAVDQELARVGAVHTGEDLHERGLAGAVLPDEAVHLAAEQLDVPVLERVNRAEALLRVLEGDDGRFRRCRHVRRGEDRGAALARRPRSA